VTARRGRAVKRHADALRYEEEGEAAWQQVSSFEEVAIQGNEHDPGINYLFNILHQYIKQHTHHCYRDAFPQL
jgi:hypothetical protein